MSIKEVIKKIDPQKEYNISDIKKEELFPGIKNIATIRVRVKKDYFRGDNVLKAMITGLGRGTDYKIKGSNIIKYLKKYGEELLMKTK